MRTKLAFKNTLVSLVLQIVTAISGLIVPRFFTAEYGSAVNGLVSSVSQFIVYMGLVEAGISAAGTVQLYKPLLEKKYDDINSIISGAKVFYRRSGMIFVTLALLLILIYPIIVKNEIADTSFIRMMIFVLSINGIVDYFILGKYRVLLIADQRNYIISFIQIIGVLVTMTVSIFLIKIEASPIIVKSTAAIVYLLRTVFIVLYVRRYYPYLDLKVPPRKDAFTQKSNALIHQIVGMIVNNTDIVLLTLLLKVNALVEVSVYSIYNLVAYALTSLFESISVGLRASFGQVISEGNKETLRRTFSQFEYLYFMILFVVYTCMAILLYSFIGLYSRDFNDADSYTRWSLVVLFTFCGFIQNLRVPGSTIQVAAGHFKETQGAAILEAVINLGVSLVLIFNFGIAGVLFGTSCSYLYRTSYVIWYNDKHFNPGTLGRTLFRLVRSATISIGLVLIFTGVATSYIDSWLSWFTFSILVFAVSAISIVTINIIFEPAEFKKILLRMKER